MDLLMTDNFNVEGLIANLNNINISFKFNEALGFAEVYLNDINIENEIRTLEVSNFVSKVAEISEVRQKLVEQQQQMGKVEVWLWMDEILEPLCFLMLNLNYL